MHIYLFILQLVQNQVSLHTKLLFILFILSLECTEIKSDLELEKVLEQLPAQVSNKKMCRYLGIKGCNQLERSGTLEPGRIAEEYCHQKINPCWEDIIRHLCEDFFDNRLAKTVADSHGSIPYSKYCK